MQKFDKYELCYACANDPHESGKFWKPKFNKDSQTIHAQCGLCGYEIEREVAGSQVS
jgi:hypothetical protein